MRKITIIGKNSKLYNNLKDEITQYIDKEYSHNEIDSISSMENVLVFSFNPSSTISNINFLKKILEKTEGKLIYVSSSSIYANSFCAKYKYPIIKKEVENYLLQSDNTIILRIGIVEEFISEKWYHGKIKLSTKNRIINGIKESILTSSRSIDAWESVYIQNPNIIKRLSHRLLVLCNKNLSHLFYLTRPLDLILKLFNFKNYGYTFLSNQFENHSKQMVIGSGMSALGVLEAFSEKNELKNSFVIHAKSTKINFSEISSPLNPIESLANGGNSNLWHSVISKFLDDKDSNQTFEKFFNKYFPESTTEDFQINSSFIPYFPLRPLKKIKLFKNYLQGLIDDHIFLIEKQKSGLIIAHGKKSSYTTDKLFLCTGSISTLQLLSNSKFIDKETSSTLSEHLVGYFGQFSGSLESQKTIRTKNGHFKYFHEIKLNQRKIFVTLRPANFSFRNLETANDYRNFFGRGTRSILLSLISKFNLALITEALYNKLGIELNFSKKYNIVGHIESKNTVEINCFPFKNPIIHYKEKKIVFSYKEKEIIKKYLQSIGVTKQILINTKTHVSPGIHFLNSSLRAELLQLPKGIKFYGTLLFEDDSPKHPTFDLLVYSYQETLNTLKSN